METAAKPNYNSCFLAFCFGFVYRVLNLTRATTLLQVTTIVIWKLPQVIKTCHRVWEASILSPAFPGLMGIS